MRSVGVSDSMPWEALLKIFVENPSFLFHVLQTNKQTKNRAKPFAKDRNRVTNSVHLQTKGRHEERSAEFTLELNLGAAAPR